MKKSAFILLVIGMLLSIQLASSISIGDSISGNIVVSGKASSQQIGVKIQVLGPPLNRWINISGPEGIFEPENTSLTGTHVHTLSIKFIKLNINPSEVLSCKIKQSNGSLFNVNITGISSSNSNYSLNYTLQSSDSIINDPSSHYIPWVLKNCSIISGASIVYSQELDKRMYVHNPAYWTDDEVTRAVACEGTPGVYFNNTAKCQFSQDTLFALQMRNGNPVTESCFNNNLCSGDYCKGIAFPTCDPLSYFGGYSALSDDPNGYTTFNANFAYYSTQVAYTRYTNTSGQFKLKINENLNAKTFSITIYNLTDISSANVYGLDTGGGTTYASNNGDGTFNVAHNRFTAFTGSLDFVFNISFNSLQNQNRTLKIVLAYGTDTNQGNPATFPVEFSSSYGLQNNNEGQSTSKTNELNGVCGDNVNNDFDYLVGGWSLSNDCYDPDCNLKLGALQSNEFGINKIGLCNYATETNCSDQFNNDYNDYADCHDADCFNNNAECASYETICNDNLNNDWDYTKSSNLIENNGTKYNPSSGFIVDLTDCSDIDCNNRIGGTSGQLCNWGYELNCSDGLNNDALQLKDCELSLLAGTTSMPSASNAEYDCAQFCRQTINQETGALCDNNKDDDYDAVIVSGYYSGIANTSYGSGTDCRWGGYFGIGSDYNPDEDCNQTVLSNGKKCELMQEKTCNDGFDNDFDKDASGMPHAGWSLNPSAYQAYFGQAFVNYADYDDYDCKSSSPASESINPSWCFDGIDNNLDAYYFNGANYVLNSSTGIDCADSTCSNIVNPSNPLQSCALYEYNSSVPFLNDSARCSDSIDNDLNGLIDCSDLSCFKQFNMCSLGQCKNQENVTWNSCSDGINNDYSDGIDCADSNCAEMIGSRTGALCKINEVCNDNFDNDADSMTDCSDHTDCDDQIGGKTNNLVVYCRATEDCSDNFDNDADGKIDCYDEDCNSACSLSTISGTTPITLPVSANSALNSVSSAYISTYTKQIRKGEWYSLNIKDEAESTNAQWTLGTASKPFNKAAFNVTTAYLTGSDAGSFSLTETQNGFVINSNHYYFPAGYNLVFIIKSNNILSSSTYELTYAEEEGSKISLNNLIYHEVDENTAPSAQSIQLTSDMAGKVYARANISDNNQLGSCSFSISGPQSFNSESTECKTSFIPLSEGIYYVNVTPKDYYSNIGGSISQPYNVNLIPLPVKITIDKSIPFYNPSELLEVNATFNVPSSDSLGICEVIAKNSSTEISLGSFSASGNSCYRNNIAIGVLSNGVYRIFAKATETTEGNIVESNSTALFVCSNSNGVCRFSDFNSDGMADSCPDIIAPNINVLSPSQNAQVSGIAEIKISTNENAVCKYSLNSTFDFNYGILFTSTNSMNHSFSLSDAGIYNLYYKCNDSYGNINSLSTGHNFTILAGAGGIIIPTTLPGGGGQKDSPCVDDSYCSKGYGCQKGKCSVEKKEEEKKEGEKKEKPAAAMPLISPEKLTAIIETVKDVAPMTLAVVITVMMFAAIASGALSLIKPLVAKLLFIILKKT